MAFHNLFSSKIHAVAYGKHRPHYPKEVHDRIVSFLKEDPQVELKLALDVGCGTGQATRPLAQYFERVIGIDVSESQITEAKKQETNTNVSYRVGTAFKFPVEDNSVQLVTTSLAAHWFNPIETFYAEADRVLTPGGVLVVYGYGLSHLEYEDSKVSEELNKLYWEFHNDSVISPFWTEKRYDVENHYANFKLPYILWLRDESMAIRNKKSLLDYVGYLSSYSAYQKYMEKQGENVADDPLETLLNKFHKVIDPKMETSPEDIFLEVSWPVFILMGRKPRVAS